MTENLVTHQDQEEKPVFTSLSTDLLSSEGMNNGYDLTQPNFNHIEDSDTEKIEGSIYENTNFGYALRHLKDSLKVQRAGWNGKGMYLFLIGTDMSKEGIGGWTYTNGKNDNMALLPFIAMKTADDKVVPWLASQTDILAEDWSAID